MKPLRGRISPKCIIKVDNSSYTQYQVDYNEELSMRKAQQNKFDSLYHQHVSALKRQGKSKATVDSYSWAVRRIATYFDRCPDRLSAKDLKVYFDDLLKAQWE
jgi:hypothetical protein